MNAAYRLLAGLLALVACSACSPGRLIESARLGVDAAAGADGATEAAGRRRAVNLAGVTGDLFLPPAPRAALLMVPGVTPQGRDDPRLIAFAGTLARHGFLVFVPELPGLRTQRVGPDDPRAIAQAGDALAACYRADEPVRFGVSAISYAVAPAILAALTEPGGERMALILGIGGYHDVTAAITYLTTGYYRSAPGATWRRGMPEPLARWVFALAAARQLPESRDRELLGMIARARLEHFHAERG